MKKKLLFTVFALSISGWTFAQVDTPPTEENACTATAANSLSSCNSAAESENQLALANCQNNTTDQPSCISSAATAKEAALKLCTDKNAGELEACSRLGGEAYSPTITPGNFSATVTNKYFPIVAGSVNRYQGTIDGKTVTAELAPTGATKVIQGVTTSEIKTTISENDLVIGNNYDYFAQDTEGSVWIFAHSSQTVLNDVVTAVDGWMAGEKGAQAGIYMKATPEVGDVYRKNYALQVSEEVGEVQSITETVTVPAGQYTNVVKTKETDATVPSMNGNAFYAENVGLVQISDSGSRVRLDLAERSTTPEPTPTPDPTPVP